MPATSTPRRMRDVIPASAARYVIASKVSPGPSPYIGWKWSKPQTPSKPSSSASWTRRMSSSHGNRCWATSSPKRMSVLWMQVAHERGRPFVEVDRNVVLALVVDRCPVLCDVLDSRRRPCLHVTLGLGEEDSGEAAEAGGVDLAGHRAVLVGEECGHRRHEVGRHLGRGRARTAHAGQGPGCNQVDLDAVVGAC